MLKSLFLSALGVFLSLVIPVVPQAEVRRTIPRTSDNARCFERVGKYTCYVCSEPNALGLIRRAGGKRVLHLVSLRRQKGLLGGAAGAAGGVRRAYRRCMAKRHKDPDPAVDPTPDPPREPGYIVSFEAAGSGGSASLRIPSDEGEWVDRGAEKVLLWALPGPLSLKDPVSGETVAVLLSVSVEIARGDFFRQKMSLSMQAGAVETSFRATLGQMSFPSLSAARAQVSASAGLEEIQGDGGVLMDLPPHGITGIASAQYNAPAPDGEILRNMISFISCSPGPCRASGGEGPYSLSFDRGVQSMSGQLRFSVSAGDKASAAMDYRIAEIAP